MTRRASVVSMGAVAQLRKCANLGAMPVSTVEHVDRVVTPAAIAFVEELTRVFRPRIEALLTRRRAAQQRLDNGERLDFLPDTAEVRRSDWRVPPLPAHLQDRPLELTGPV